MNTAGYDSKMAALYYPWIEVMDPLTQAADDDAAVGPHRRRVVRASTPPAACTRRPANEVVLGANGLGVPGHARRAGRAQPGRASTASARSPAAASAIWGARTLSSDPEWRYINVRRLFNYVSESIMDGHAVERVRAQRPDGCGRS